jgi:hypothetical protein
LIQISFDAFVLDYPQQIIKPEDYLNNPLTNISGFFSIDTSTRSIKKTWIIILLISCVVLAVAAYDFLKSPSEFFSSRWPFLSYLEKITAFLYSLFFRFLLPVGLIIKGIKKIVQNHGIYLTGIRTTDSGFEVGTLTVNLASVEWGKTGSGRILAGDWKPGIKISADSLVTVSLKQEPKLDNTYSFSGFTIFSKTQTQLVYKVNGEPFSEMAAVVNNSFQQIGIVEVGQDKDVLQSLELIADVLATFAPDAAPLCTLNLEAKRAVPMGALFLSPALLIYEWAYNDLKRQEMRRKFKDSQLLDVDTTERLLEFLNRRGWMITIDGE